MVSGYWTSDEPVVDDYNLLADMIEAGDADSAAAFMKEGQMVELLDLLNLKGDFSFKSKVSAIKNLTAKQRNAVASKLRSNAAAIKSEKSYKPAGKTNESPAIPETADIKAATPAPVKPIAPVADKAKAEVKAPVATATPDIKPTTATTPSTDKTTTPATPTTDAATPAAPVETPEERHQKIVEAAKSFVDSNILQGKKPEDINWTDKKVTDNITTNYNILDDEHKAEAEKQLMKLATGNPEAEAAVKDAKNILYY